MIVNQSEIRKGITFTVILQSKESGSPVQRVLEAGIDVEEVVRVPYVQIKIKMFQMFVGTCVSKNMI